MSENLLFLNILNKNANLANFPWPRTLFKQSSKIIYAGSKNSVPLMVFKFQATKKESKPRALYILICSLFYVLFAGNISRK